MRPKLFLTKEIKAVDPSDGIKKEVYKRVTEKEAEEMLYNEFKRVRALSKRGEVVEFTLIKEYPYKKKKSSPDFINDDEDGVVYAPILVFGWQRKFLPFRKKYNLKPVLQGMCMVIDKKIEEEDKDEDDMTIGSESDDFANLKDDEGSNYEDDVEEEVDENAPEGRHIAFVVDKSHGVMSRRVLRDVLEPIKNQLGRKRYHIYDKMPSPTR
jgi:hypothetical protein